MDEQNVIPLIHHIDIDDARSWHFVISTSSSSSSLTEEGDQQLKPIGTCRLLPPPHALLPKNGEVIFAPDGVEVPVRDAEEIFSEERLKKRVELLRQLEEDEREKGESRIGEIYLQIGRLCVLKDWRGKGVADALVQEVCRWASEKWRSIEREEGGSRACLEGAVSRGWQGLILVHARVEAVTMWERNGFVIDEALGRWEEAGIKHVGMVRRVIVVEE